MRVLFAALVLVALAAGPASAAGGAPTVSTYEYRHATHGLLRHDTQALFDTRGVWVTEWYDEVGDGHLWRNYPADDGTIVEVVYRKRYGQNGWHLTEKCRPATPTTPCNQGATS